MEGAANQNKTPAKPRSQSFTADDFDSNDFAEVANPNKYLQELEQLFIESKNQPMLMESQDRQQISSIIQDDSQGFIDLDMPVNEMKQDVYQYKLNNKKARAFNPSIEQSLNNVPIDDMDASKRSTSPPSTSIRQSLRPTTTTNSTPKDLSQQIHNLVSGSLNQQQLLLRIIDQNENDGIQDALHSLQQMQIHHQEQLMLIENLQKQQVQQYEQVTKQQNEGNLQRFKIKSEIDTSQSSMGKEIDAFFGNQQKFIQSLKNDQLLVFNFMKYLQSKAQSQPSSIQPAKPQTQSNQRLQRKASDPQFDNEEYLRQIEEKYMQQFEQQLTQDNQRNEINSIHQSKERLSIINQSDQPKDKKKKRMQSDDKYDKKEFQERMEHQFMQLIKQQFPVESSDEETKSDKLDADLVAIDLGANYPKRLNMNKGVLHIDMPEELVALLGDSKDMLEDPNSQMNYFELESLDSQIHSSNGATTANGLLAGMGIETPAFGKKKNPSLSIFKDAALPDGKKRQCRPSPDLLQKGGTDKNAQTYDNWKSEVGKVFSKKKPIQPLSKQSPAIVTMQSNMSPITKSKSPTSSTQASSRNNRLDHITSTGTHLKEKTSKTVSNFQSMQDSNKGRSSKSPNHKSTFVIKDPVTVRGKVSQFKGKDEGKKQTFTLSTNAGNVNQSLSSSSGSLLSSRNQKLARANTQQSNIEIAISKIQQADFQAKELSIDLKAMDPIGGLTQGQQLNSARIAGGGGRIPVGSGLMSVKSRNMGASKSPSLR